MMAFNFFRRDNRKRSRDTSSGCVRTSGSSGITNDDGRRPRRKLQKIGRRKSESEVVPYTGAQAFASSSQKRTAGSPATSEPRGLDISDVVLDPYQYTALLQASAARDNHVHNERPTTPSTNGLSGDVEAPPSTPLPHVHAEDSQDNRAGCLTEHNLSSLLFSSASSEARGTRSFNAITEGITYDAILASTLQKTLGPMSEEGVSLIQPPETRVPPNSPVFLAGCGRFSSLVGVSMAIMENRI